MIPKVCHFITTLHTGGTEKQLLELLRAFDRDRWDVRLVCFRPDGAFANDFRALGIEPRWLRVDRTLARPATLLVIRRLAGWLRREGTSLLHCHDVYSVLVGVPAARLAGIPVIAARRDLGHHLSTAKRLALRLVMTGATAVLANAATVAAQAAAEDGVNAARLAIVPNGLDLPSFDARAAGPLVDAPGLGTRDAGGLSILSVARMTHPAKGHDDLLATAALVARELPGVRFYVAGDGPREGELRGAANALGLQRVVVFLGRRADVPALLVHADLLYHPARAEGLPNAVLEAMAARRPVVATAVGGVPELVQHGHTGLLVPPQDPQAAARAILTLFRDPARAARMGAAGRARVAADFTIERLVARTESLYQRLIARI